jgi:Na+-driven multidrug efflux pump
VQDLTTGSVTRHLLKTSSFMLVTMVFQTLYFLVDLYWVGRLGKESVAAVAVAGNLTFVVLALSQMLGVGTTTVVSHAAGRKDRERAVLLFNQSQVLSLVCGVAFLVVMMALRVPTPELWLPTPRRRHWPPTTCSGSFRRCRCSLRWSRWARHCAAPATSSPG